MAGLSSEEWRELPLRLARSSGTTGRPLRVVRGPTDRAAYWEVVTHAARDRGVSLRPRGSVALWDALPGARDAIGETPWGRVGRVAADTPDASARIEAFDPQVLSTDPVGLRRLLARRPRVRPEVIVSSGIHLSAELRAAVESAWSVPVVDVYGLAEVGPVAVGCPEVHGAWHVLAAEVSVEAAPEGLRVTRWRDGVVPVVRYQTDDRGEVGTACACGHLGAVLRGLSGRRAVCVVGERGPVDVSPVAVWLRGADAWRMVRRGDRWQILVAGDRGEIDAAAITGWLRGKGLRVGDVSVDAWPDGLDPDDLQGPWDLGEEG